MTVDRPILVVWARVDDDEPESVRTFGPHEYADCYELNRLSDAYPPPAAFYGVRPAGDLMALTLTTTSSGYDANDYASITHTWTDPGGLVYTVGYGQRDGRA